MGSVILSFFAIAIVLFQLSCQKTAVAQTNTGSTVSQLNKIIYIRRPTSRSSEVWTANYDGTSQTKISIVLPGALIVSGARLSPDCQSIFLLASDSVTFMSHIYSCKINGTNVQKVVDGSTTPQGFLLEQAY